MIDVRRAEVARHEPDVAFCERSQRLLLLVADRDARKNEPKENDSGCGEDALRHAPSRTGAVASGSAPGSPFRAIGIPMARAARASACDDTGLVMKTK